MKFKVGDRVRVKEGMGGEFYAEGAEGIIKRLGIEDCTVNFYKGEFKISGNNSWYVSYFRIEPISEGNMSKYEELKQRIEAINGGTTLQEFGELLLMVGNENHYLCLPTTVMSDIGKGGEFEIQNNTGSRTNMNGYEVMQQPCDAIPCLKKEFLWLLDHSDIKKDEKTEEVKSIKEEMKKLEERLTKLEG